jgi:hypothetical protein
VNLTTTTARKVLELAELEPLKLSTTAMSGKESMMKALGTSMIQMIDQLSE